MTVLEIALSITDKTIVNDADLDVTLGENTYKLKTNTVKNPVDDEDEPQKDVKSGSDDPANDVNSASIDGVKVAEGDILTYTITYENKEADAVDVTIKDAPPTGTVYVAGSAGSTLSDSTTVTIDADNNITWVIRDLATGSSVTVYFQVEVTKAALSIIDQTIVNDAEVSDGKNTYTTNTVKNPTSDTPENPGDVGKVIINADGTESTVSTGAFGDTVTFDVSIDAVNLVADEGRITNDTNTYNDQVAYYYIYDQMDPGFTLMTGSFTLTINNVTYDIISTGTDVTSGATTYTFGAGTTTVGTMYTYVNTDADGNTINTLIGVTIYWADADGNGLYSDCEIHLTYTATINENAAIAGSGNLNRAIYDYSVVGHDNPEEPDPEDPKYPSGSDLNHETEERTTVTYTYALGIYKISAETGEALSGAEFTFADAGGNTIYMAETDVDGVYNYCSAGTTGATDTVVSNSDGQIIIKGVDIGTYTLTEVKAPKGYVLLTDPVMLKATMSSSAATTVKSSTTVTRIFDAITESEFAAFAGTVYTKDEDGTFVETEKPAVYTSGLYQMVSSSTSTSEDGQTTVTETYAIEATSVTIENAAGISLPSTGGIGTTIFYIIGGILVFGAVVLLITRKRMKKID
ncbi:MAG: LPXTG cell wall anchor domain-containing protein [Lachnospiraceae bacterium]|nr:LPXTG cell wall anchor domain-containing protein [Lachnospiraceae bacterium]